MLADKVWLLLPTVETNWKHTVVCSIKGPVCRVQWHVALMLQIEFEYSSHSKHEGETTVATETSEKNKQPYLKPVFGLP